jgi:hypothetical protein
MNIKQVIKYEVRGRDFSTKLDATIYDAKMEIVDLFKNVSVKNLMELSDIIWNEREKLIPILMNVNIPITTSKIEKVKNNKHKRHHFYTPTIQKQIINLAEYMPPVFKASDLLKKINEFYKNNPKVKSSSFAPRFYPMVKEGVFSIARPKKSRFDPTFYSFKRNGAKEEILWEKTPLFAQQDLLIAHNKKQK